jgi:hypothetical protein
MSGCDYIDIMAADPLESDHHVRQILILDLLSFSLVRDRPVLAEDTAEVAIGEKDGTGPISANQGYLFTKMGMRTENHGSCRGPAKALFAL